MVVTELAFLLILRDVMTRLVLIVTDGWLVAALAKRGDGAAQFLGATRRAIRALPRATWREERATWRTERSAGGRTWQIGLFSSFVMTSILALVIFGISVR